MRTVTKDQLIKIVAAAMAARDQATTLVPKTRTSDGRVPPTKFPGTKLSTFQKLDGTLTVDNYYGPNTVAALKWYLQKAKNPKVPLAAAKYDHIKVTWVAPSLYEPTKATTQAAVPTPAPAPAPAPAKKPSSSGLGIDLNKISDSAKAMVAKAPLASVAEQNANKAKEKAAKEKAAKEKAAKEKAAKEKAAKAKKAKQKVPATPAFGQELNSIKPGVDAEEIIAKAVSKSSSALNKINQKLLKDALQKQATSEHKILNKDAAFKKEVLARLKSLSSKIKGGAPAQKTVTGERRIVGLVL